LQRQTSNIFEIDSTYQFACGAIANAAELNVKVSAMQNSGITRLLPGNARKNYGKDGNNECGNRRDIVAVGSDEIAKNEFQ
jgi:hypothetical protein